jgi:large subunit ribosomal protein L18
VIDKTKTRLRRAKKTRCMIKKLGVARLSIHRTSLHIYAQLINSDSKVLATASTLDKTLVKDIKYTGNIKAAEQVGKSIAERAIAAGIKKVAFDRSGFRYHGRVKALADAARKNGLEF